MLTEEVAEDATAKTLPSPSISNGTHNGLHKVLPTQDGGLHSDRDGVRSQHITTYGTHDREEVTRLMIQSLENLGYSRAAQLVREESGLQLEIPIVSAFRAAVLSGDWSQAEQILGSSKSDPAPNNGLPLAAGTRREKMRFWLRRQKYLEQLERGEVRQALMTLRTELTPLESGPATVRFLARLLMLSSPEELKAQAEWDGAAGRSRGILLSKLLAFVSPHAMLPENRHETLLQHVKDTQIRDCTYHTSDTSPSLYFDHVCDRQEFPSYISARIKTPLQEVWQVRFSHDGTKLASCGTGPEVHVWSLAEPRKLTKLGGHLEGIGNVSWSHDDKQLATCGRDNHLRIFDAITGVLSHQLERVEEPVSSCVWRSDDSSVVVGTLDKKRALVTYHLDEQRTTNWNVDYRVQDVTMSPDGHTLVVVDVTHGVHFYDFHARTELYTLNYKVPETRISSVAFTADSKCVLINKNDGIMELYDLASRRTIQKYEGHKVGAWVIRGQFGGAHENFVIAGSDDGSVHIWNKHTGKSLFSQPKAHQTRANSVAWSPTDPGLWVSCGDDGVILIWTNRARAQTTEQWMEFLQI